MIIIIVFIISGLKIINFRLKTKKNFFNILSIRALFPVNSNYSELRGQFETVIPIK